MLCDVCIAALQDIRSRANATKSPSLDRSSDEDAVDNQCAHHLTPESLAQAIADACILCTRSFDIYGRLEAAEKPRYAARLRFPLSCHWERWLKARARGLSASEGQWSIKFEVQQVLEQPPTPLDPIMVIGSVFLTSVNGNRGTTRPVP